MSRSHYTGQPSAETSLGAAGTSARATNGFDKLRRLGDSQALWMVRDSASQRTGFPRK